MVKNHVFRQKSQFSGIFKKSILHFKDALFRSRDKRTNKTWYPSLTFSILGYFGEFLKLRKMQEQNANKIHYVYNALVVLHICISLWVFHHQDILKNENQILMLIKF